MRMKNVIYKISYIPHIKNNTPPYYYIGSKYNYMGEDTYYGSPSSQFPDWYTNGQSIASWWKETVKSNPELFKFEVLEEVDDSNPKDLAYIEEQYHRELDVTSKYYFNSCIANGNFVSGPKDLDTRKKISDATKVFWSTEEGTEKKARLAAMNRDVKPQQMRDKWTDPDFKEAMKSRPAPWTGKKRPYQKRNRKSQPVEIDGVVYESANVAAKAIGIHVVNVRRRCRLDNYKEWKYVEIDHFE